MTDFVLGGGVTGLATGMASGFTVLEAAETPGGICGSYYLTADGMRLSEPPANGEAFRFERGGGHWIFGADELVLPLLQSFGPLASYRRKAAVYFPSRNLYVPYPIQNHGNQLSAHLPKPAAGRAARSAASGCTLRQWLASTFGPTLCEEFFFPFHELYTAGLYHRIAPQDDYKSPTAGGAGYNVDFLYPVSGLDALTKAMAGRCRVRYQSKVTAIDTKARRLLLHDGSELGYTRLVSTLALNQMLELTKLQIDATPDPWTSVLVLNLAARRGRECPDLHWVYLPATEAGFHRVGFYDNVEPSFLPRSKRAGELTSLYVERAFLAGARPTPQQCEAYAAEVVRELQDWSFIEQALLIDPTWIEVAYTWSWPNSVWKNRAIEALAADGITQVGRYARWVFQGIGASIRDGLLAGVIAKHRD